MHSSQQAAMHSSLVSPDPVMSPDALSESAAMAKGFFMLANRGNPQAAGGGLST